MGLGVPRRSFLYTVERLWLLKIIESILNVKPTYKLPKVNNVGFIYLTICIKHLKKNIHETFIYNLNLSDADYSMSGK